MSDLLNLKARLERLVERLERLQAIPSPQGQVNARVTGLVNVGKNTAMALHALLDLIESELSTPARDQGDEPTGTERIDEVVARVSGQLGIPSIDLDAVELDREVVTIIPREVAIRHQLIAFGWLDEGGKSYLQVAMVDPTNIFAKDDVRFAIGREIKTYVSSKAAIERAIKKYYPRPDPERA